MKYLKSILFLLAALNFSGLFAQVVTFEPSFATENDSLVVTFDATQGNAGLEDFDGDVYLHTGVITNESTSGSDWKHVPFGWETNDESVKATFLGDNKWEFKYLPSIHEFFEMSSATEKVEQVAIVFKGVKNGQIVAEGKDEGNADIFIEITTGEVSSRFLSPANEIQIMEQDESLDIVGIGSVNIGDLELSLEKNGTEIESVSSDTLKYTFTPEIGEDDVRFDLIANNGAGLSDTSSIFITVINRDEQLENRPSDLRDGITYDASKVTFSLFAPGKDIVFVIGEFNDWTPSSEYLMKKDSLKSDSVWHWLEIENLISGQEYSFQYLIDGELRIADPYSELVLDEYNDEYISASTFPNLKAYPKGKTSGLVGIIQPGKSEYNWEATEYIRPDKEELVIYELLLRDFLEEANYSTLIDTLDYLDNLGVNAIELMPVNEFDGNLSWGYNPALHLALDKYYGTPEDFKRFVDEAHKRGIAVILDVVLNHATGQNPLYRLYGSENPYFNVTAKHDYNVFNDMNHEYSGTRYYSKRVMEYWIQEYKIDGYRFDLSKGFTQKNTLGNTGAWGNKDDSRIAIWKDYADAIWELDADVYVILEHFADNNEEKILADYGMMLWGNMNHEYNEASMGYNSNLSGVLAESRGFADRNLVSYMESHDEQWLMFKNISFGNSSGNYDITDLNTALDRQKLVGAFFYTLPGPKMIWQFGELGYGYGDNGEQCLNDSSDCPSSAPGRTAEKPIRWDYYDDANRAKLYKTWSALINLRRSSPAFTNPDEFNFDLDGTLKSITLQHEDSDVLIVGNFGVNSSDVPVTFTTTGTWYDFFEGSSADITETEQTVNLAPGEFKIYTTKEFETPEEGITTAIDDGDMDVPAAFRLEQNYPNPFNPSTVISYQLAVNSKVTLKVYDMLGREVATLVNGQLKAGNHSVKFDAQNLASGIYIYRLQAGSKVFTEKMTLIK
ncbi:MAG: alpha-amylase family glycosyl hydrolase [Balneolaceae bacterium]